MPRKRTPSIGFKRKHTVKTRKDEAKKRKTQSCEHYGSVSQTENAPRIDDVAAVHSSQNLAEEQVTEHETTSTESTVLLSDVTEQNVNVIPEEEQLVELGKYFGMQPASSPNR